mmetsp:Transcript_58535/g.92521  ORF Transcript_58535/g.92521 Transcript_58535/m.92521 type:complete len:124 (-) Transcript_58535:93-464(-)
MPYIEDGLEAALCDDEDARKPLTSCQCAAVTIFWTVLILYFIPMLTFIPMVFIGGFHVPNPFVKGYNNQTKDRVWEEVQAPQGLWYWDPVIVTCITAGVPMLAVLVILILQRMRRSAKEDHCQ